MESITGFLASLRRRSPASFAAAVVLVIHVVTALTGPLWAPYSPNEMRVGRPYSPPSVEHLLGTDKFGRDVFSRLICGEQIVLGLALSATAVAMSLGTIVGLLTGYTRGWVDDIVMRVVDIMLSIPPLIVALLVLGSLGSNAFLIIATVAVLYVPRVTNVIRAATLEVVTEDFVTAARLRGESSWSIALRELLPNVIGTVFVEFSLRTGYAVIFIGGLSFLGFGPPPPTPEWGAMINEGRSYIEAAPWVVLSPSIGIASVVISLSIFTEGLKSIMGHSSGRRGET